MKPVVKFRQGESIFDVVFRARKLLGVSNSSKAIEMTDKVSKASSMDEAWRILGEYVTLVVQN